MTVLSLSHLNKSFTIRQGAIVVLKDINLQVNSGELVALLGPSGCGKSTLLRLVAGLIAPDSGDICFDGKSVLSVPTEKRETVIVFQENQLFPFMTVAENIAFGLKIRRWKRASIQRRIGEILDLVNLGGLDQRYPDQLSGGQRQRVALGRALAVSPRLLLLDEPFSSLDLALRDSLRQELMSLQKELGITTIFVTHDQTEAVRVANRIALLIDNQIVQVGQGRDFFEHPREARVARFFGISNILPAHKLGRVIDIGGFQLETAHSHLPDGDVLAVVRPEAVQLGTNGSNTLHGTIQEWSYQGNTSHGRIQIGQVCLHLTTPPHVVFAPQESLAVHVAPEHIWLMPKESKELI